MEFNNILRGDAYDVLKTLPDESINMVMTSPPYWALRDYGIDSQLGLEEKFGEYINNLCDIFDEIKRVLRKEGTCWVNLGDCYAGNMGKKSGWTDNKLGYEKQEAIDKEVCLTNKIKIKHQLPQKCLVGIPFRFAIEMMNRGWILRNTIIWHKPNCMPSSARDRFTIDYEYLFFFVKNKKYWFEQQFEKQSPHTLVAFKDGKVPQSPKSIMNPEEITAGKTKQAMRNGREWNAILPNGRNMRTVWKIATQPFPEAHFAVYPEALCETPIKAGCPGEVCKKCGKPVKPAEKLKSRYETIKITCDCNAGFEPGIVLDPFMGSGTTAVVALKQNKRFLGIESNEKYINIAKKRIKPQLSQIKLRGYYEK